MSTDSTPGSGLQRSARTRASATITAPSGPGHHPALALLEPPGPASCTLLVLPHAGGSPGLYRFLRGVVPGSTRIAIARYPGREKRMSEPFVDSLPDLAEEISAAVAATALRNPVILGHSMGGLLAIEVARLLLPDAALTPPAVIISGRGPVSPLPTRPTHTLSDEEFIDHLYALGTTPAGLFDSPDARALFLPPVRDDYRLVETYTRSSTAPLPVPIHCFAGENDPTVTVEQVAGLAELSTQRFDLTVFPGGHFFLTENLPTVGAALTRILEQTRTPGHA